MGAWTLRVTGIEQGLVTLVHVKATRKCGRVEDLTAYQFPAGWRMNGDGIPASLKRDVMRLVREVWQ